MFTKIFPLLLLTSFFLTPLEGRIVLNNFINKSGVEFTEVIAGNKHSPYSPSSGAIVVDQRGLTLVSKSGNHLIHLVDGGETGYDRPHWYFRVDVESKRSFPHGNHRIQYAYILYDGDGIISLELEESGHLLVHGEHEITDIYYLWP